MFNNEIYDYTENADGSTTLKIPKNKDGFKISITFSGSDADHEKAVKAVEDFYIKAIL